MYTEGEVAANQSKKARKINVDTFLRYRKQISPSGNRWSHIPWWNCIWVWLSVCWVSGVFFWVRLYMVECVSGGGLHNHFQLSCVFDDLLCQLRGGDGHLFCPLLLVGERVIAICAQTPSPLKWNKNMNSQLLTTGLKDLVWVFHSTEVKLI